MTNHVTTNFFQCMKHHYCEERYVHKYYLPLELRKEIRPADIKAIISFVSQADLVIPLTGFIAEEMPDITIYYNDIKMEKVATGPKVSQVLHAFWNYRKDCRAKLSPQEVQEALNLNEFLFAWEKTVQHECLILTEKMEPLCRTNDQLLTDYEIDLKIEFYLRDDDPLSKENNQETNADDIDHDITLICATTRFPGKISPRKASNQDYAGIGDNRDYNDLRHLGNCELFQVRHCGIFHEMYSHLHVPLKHLGRIGRIAAEFRIFHEIESTIDLTDTSEKPGTIRSSLNHYTQIKIPHVPDE
ncbi:hypothetical protein ACUUL3_04900 [Thiovibrio sp. JS02]